MNYRSLFLVRPLRNGIIAGAAAYAVALLGIAWIYNEGYHSELREVEAELQNLARTAAAFVDGEGHHAWLLSPSGDERKFQHLLLPLRKLHRGLPQVRHIYTAVMQPDGVYIVLDTIAVSHPLPPRRETLPAPELLTALKHGMMTSTKEPVRNSAGVFMSGFAPFHAQGRVAGVAAVEISVAEIDKRVAFWQQGVAFGAVLAFGLSWMLGRTVWRMHSRTHLFEKEQRQAETAIREGESRYLSVVNNLKEVVFQTDLEKRWTFLNNAWTEVTGFPIGESLGRSLFYYLHPDDRAACGQRCEALLRLDVEDCRMQVRFLTRSGSICWIEIYARPSFDGEGRISGITGTLDDVTKRKETEEASLLNLERLKLALGSSEQGLWDWEMASDKVYCDAQWVRILGYSLAELDQLQTPWQFFHPEDRPRLEEAFREYCEGGLGLFDVEHRARRKDGEVIWIRVRGSLIGSGPDGPPSRVIGTIENVTSRKTFETDLKRAKEAAEEADRAKSEFLAVMSHEIRTPMNGLIGFTSILSETKLDGQQLEYVGNIRNCADLLLALIDDILDFSKIESGNLELENRRFNLRECVEGTLGIFVHTAGAKEIELVYGFEEGAPEWIFGDMARLRQILVNLVSNAVKFTLQGEVIVTVSRAGPSRVRFSVADTGIGIASDRTSRLFKLFSQADSSTTRRFGGTGLGLAICKRLVELMGGEIRVESEPGKGSTFIFTVVSPGLDDLGEPATGDAHGGLAGVRVLIADDNEASVRSLGRQLRSWGLRTEEVSSPEKALATLRTEETFDLMLIDRKMRGMDGIELARRIRAIEGRRELPLILLAPHGMGGLGKRVGMVEFVATLNKPVRSSQLHNVINRVIADSVRHGRSAAAGSALAAHAAAPLLPALGERHPLKILVAEDSPVNQQIAMLMLRKLGYEAEVVPNGKAAVEAFCQRDYDLILMDLHMPEMDGLEATGEIRSWQKTNGHRGRAYIVALTADAMVGDRERCLASGMDDYLSKPLSLPELETMLRRCIGDGC